MITDNIQKLIIGASGIGASNIASNLEMIQDTSSPQLVNVIVQIVIGLFTLLGLIKKNRKKK